MPLIVAIDKLSALYLQIEADNTTVRTVLEETFQIFNLIKREPFDSVHGELRLCARIAGLCAEHITQQTTSYALFEHALSIQDFYLKNYKKDRTGLIQYLATRDRYLAMTPGIDGGFFEDLSILLDSTEFLAEEDVIEECACKIEINWPDTSPQSIVPLRPKTTIQDLRVRLERIQIQPHSNHKRKEFGQIEKDMLEQVYELKRRHSLSFNPSFHVNDPIIQDLQFALEIQAAYIVYLKTQPNMFGLSKALQRAAFLFRTLDAYYQRSDASEPFKKSFRESVNFTQMQSINIKSIMACRHVIDSEKTSPTEKTRAQKKQTEHCEMKDAGLAQICAVYQTMIGGDDTFSSSEESLTFAPDAHQILTYEFAKIQSSVPALSFYPVLQDVSAYLNHVLMCLVPQSGYNATYLPYADNHSADDVIDISQSMLMATNNGAAFQKLMQTLELYYAIKIAHLDEVRYSLAKGSADEDFVIYSRFTSETRLATYRYLLTYHSTQELSQEKGDCESILREQERATPLINALAQHRLTMVNELIQAQLLSEMNAPAKIDIAPGLPAQKPRSTSNKRRSKNRNKKEAENTAQPSVSTLWDFVEKAYEQTTLSAPGWMAHRAEVIALLEKKEFVKAHDLLDEWIESIDRREGQDRVLIDKGLYDGLLHKAIFLRCLGKYDEALLYLVKAWQHLAPEARQNTCHYQMQRVLLEKGLIYTAQHKNDLASIAFCEANEMAKKNDTFCFYIIFQELNWYQNRPKEAVERYQETLNRMLDLSRPIFVDEYSQSHFYLFNEKLASLTLDVGMELLQHAQAEKSLERDFLTLEEEGKHYLEQCIKIHSLLLEHSKKHTPSRVIEYEMKMAITYKTLWTILPQRQQLHKATEHLKRASQLATRFQRTEFIPLIAQERTKLDTVLTLRKGAIKAAVQAQSQKAYLQLRDRCFSQASNTSVECDGDINSYQAAMLEAIYKHTSLSQVKYILKVLENFTPAHRQPNAAERRKKESFEQKIMTLSVEELASIAKYLDLLKVACKEGEVESAHTGDRPPDTLIQLYMAESHYLAKMMRMEYEQTSSDKRNLNSQREEFRLAVSLQGSKVTALETKMRAFAKPNESIQALTVAECLTLHAQHMNLDMEGIEIEGFEAAILHQITRKQFWVALFDLFEMLKTREESLTLKQKGTVHFIIAKIMHWSLNMMCSDLCSKMQTQEEHADFNTIFDNLKTQCIAEFRKAFQGGGFMEFERANTIIQTVRGLRLPITNLAISPML